MRLSASSLGGFFVGTLGFHFGLLGVAIALTVLAAIYWSEPT